MPTYRKNLDGDLEEVTIIPKESIDDIQLEINDLKNKIDAHNAQNENDIRPFKERLAELQIQVDAANVAGVVTPVEEVPVIEEIVT